MNCNNRSLTIRLKSAKNSCKVYRPGSGLCVACTWCYKGYVDVKIVNKDVILITIVTAVHYSTVVDDLRVLL